jgi:hypothetical protein
MGGRHLDGSEKNALQGRWAWIELDQGQFEEGGRVGLGRNLVVGGVELRWPLSEVGRGHRLDESRKSSPLASSRAVNDTRQTRDLIGTHNLPSRRK